MRLYLSSYRIGERAGSLLALLGGGTRAAIIENARDILPPGPREALRHEVDEPAAELAALGIGAERLDLRAYFGRPEALATDLERFDLVWVTGGNSFVLRRAMKQSGFDEAILALLERDAIVYGGAGAGAMVAAPSLVGMHLMDDPDAAPLGYDAETPWDGLGLIDHAIVPHYRSPHPESAAAERAVRHLAARGLRYRALHDGEVVVWTEHRSRRVGAELRIA